MTTILVTGGAGFMGSNFVDYILGKYPDYEVTIVDLLTYAGNRDVISEQYRNGNGSRFTFFYGNIRNHDLMDELVSRSDVVVHFAAETHVTRSIHDNAIFYDTNVLGTQVVANAVVKQSKTVNRFVHISSSEVYGSACYDPMDEEHPLDPLSPYASSKAGADRLVFSYWKSYGIPAIIIRPFNNYGPRQHLEKVIPRFITSTLLNEPLTVHGTGAFTRDWVYVKDFCQALDRAIHCDAEMVLGEVINVGTRRETSVLSIAEMILEEMGKPRSLLKHTANRPAQVDRHISSTEKAEKLLGWKATTTLEDGLAETIFWYQHNTTWWEPQRWMKAIPIEIGRGKVETY
jgi:dTDP-glucose 4,6-dehydratase